MLTSWVLIFFNYNEENVVQFYSNKEIITDGRNCGEHTADLTQNHSRLFLTAKFP
jgi:hypothetical protein